MLVWFLCHYISFNISQKSIDFLFAGYDLDSIIEDLVIKLLQTFFHSLKFSADVRTIIYTTNAIESLNSTYRRLNAQRSVFPSDQALLKALYLATFEATKKWTMPVRNWGKVYGELTIMYEGRMPE